MLGHFYEWIYWLKGYFVAIPVNRRPSPAYLRAKERSRYHMAPLLSGVDNVFRRWIYSRLLDCYHRPVLSAPADIISVRPLLHPGPNFCSNHGKDIVQCINISSYNYLGFTFDSRETEDDFVARRAGDGQGMAQDGERFMHRTGSKCVEDVLESFDEYGAATCASYHEFGYSRAHHQLESDTANFLGKEDSIVFGMGFATNSLGIPLLVAGPGNLVVSDSLNHASLVEGIRGSGAVVVRFAHDDWDELEGVLRAAVVEGRPKSGLPWTRIVIIMEGIYSMEGEIVDLPRSSL